MIDESVLRGFDGGGSFSKFGGLVWVSGVGANGSAQCEGVWAVAPVAGHRKAAASGAAHARNRQLSNQARPENREPPSNRAQMRARPRAAGSG